MWIVAILCGLWRFYVNTVIMWIVSPAKPAICCCWEVIVSCWLAICNSSSLVIVIIIIHHCYHNGDHHHKHHHRGKWSYQNYTGSQLANSSSLIHHRQNHHDLWPDPLKYLWIFTKGLNVWSGDWLDQSKHYNITLMLKHYIAKHLARWPIQKEEETKPTQVFRFCCSLLTCKMKSHFCNSRKSPFSLSSSQ